MNREVNLTKRVRTERGTRYCPVAFSANGRVKPDIVLVDDKPEHHAEGSYYLEWYAGAKRVRLSVGKNAADANARRLRKEAELNALNNGVRVVPEKGTGQRSLAGAVALYLADVKLTHNYRELCGSSAQWTPQRMCTGFCSGAGWDGEAGAKSKATAMSIHNNTHSCTFLCGHSWGSVG